MPEPADEVTPDEFMLDVAVALIQRDLATGQAWRVAYALGEVLDRAASVDDDTPEEIRAYMTAIVLAIVQTLMYARIEVDLEPLDIDTEATNFSSMIEEFERARLKNNDEQED